jgi:hypothetical protein
MHKEDGWPGAPLLHGEPHAVDREPIRGLGARRARLLADFLATGPALPVDADEHELGGGERPSLARCALCMVKLVRP